MTHWGTRTPVQFPYLFLLDNNTVLHDGEELGDDEAPDW